MLFTPLEEIGPFVVIANLACRPSRVIVRCRACARVSVRSVDTLSDKRIGTQQNCAKCRNYVTRTTWTKGVKHGRD